MMNLRSTAAAVASAVALVGGVSIAVLHGQSGKAVAGKQTVAVFKSPTCGCCAKWNDHMTAAGWSSGSRWRGCRPVRPAWSHRTASRPPTR
jgi:hypothetical protein